MVMVMVVVARARVCCRQCVCERGRHNQQWCPPAPHLCTTAAYLRGGAAPIEHPVDLIRPVRWRVVGGRAGGRRVQTAITDGEEGQQKEAYVKDQLLESAMERWGAAGPASGCTVPRKQREGVCEVSARLTPNPSGKC